ncbi:MAG: bifunctional oligoribonuclease/PAP phosphatase NrnA [Planctomycetota bacterium]
MWADRFLAFLGDRNDFVLVGHVSLDGDCVGSQIALYHVLRKLGRRVRIVNSDPLPHRFDFVSCADVFEAWDPARHEEVLRRAGGLCVLDVSEWGRLGEVGRAARAAKLESACFDHHVIEERVFDEYFWDSEASATGTLIARIADELDLPMTQEMAEGVFIALVSDTGWFVHDNTDSSAFRLAARLADTGLDTARIHRALYQRVDRSTMQLVARAAAEARFDVDGRLAWTRVTQEMAAGDPARVEESDLALGLLRSIDGVEVVVLLREIRPETVQVSWRACPGHDVQRIAASFGGGGHRLAAGATLQGTLADAEGAVLSRTRSILVQDT